MGSGTPILLRTTVGPKWPGVRSPTSSNSTLPFPTQPTAVSSPPLLYLSSCIPHLFRLLLTFCTLTFILAQVHHACSERQGNMTFDVAHFCINQINFSEEEKIPPSANLKAMQIKFLQSKQKKLWLQFRQHQRRHLCHQKS